MKALLSFRMALKQVRAAIGRMALSVLAVALGVSLVIAIQLMNASVLASFLDTVDGMAGRAALTISAGDGLTFDAALLDRVAAIHGVRIAVPLVTGVAFPDDGSGELLTVHGVDLLNDTAVRVYHRAPSGIIDDVAAFLNQPDSIVLGREYAARRGLEVGSQLDVVTPSGVKRFTVRGLLEPEGLARTLGGRLIVMDLYAAQRVFAAPDRITQIDVVVEPGRESTVKREVAAILPAGVKVEEPILRKQVLQRTVGSFEAMLTAFALLAVVAGFVICYSRLAAVFEARTWVVGLLRAVGLPRVVVFIELLKEALLLGLTGVAIGMPLGVVIARKGLPFVSRAVAMNYRLAVPAADVPVTIPALVTGIMVGLGAAVLAAVVPAMQVASRQPVAALTMRGRDIPAVEVRGVPRLVLILPAVAVAFVWVQVALDRPSLGNVTTGLVAATAGVASAPLVRGGGALLAVVWRWLFGPAGAFAVAHLRQQARRAALTIATLGIGLGAVLMFGILAWSFERTLVASTTARVRSDLVISSAFVSGGYRGSPLAGTVVDALAAIEGVRLAVGVQEHDLEYGNGAVVVYGYDPVCFRDPSVCDWHLRGDALVAALDRVSAGSAVIVSGSFARHHHAKPGDVIRLDSAMGPVDLTVAGITDAEVVNAVIMNRELYRRQWNDPLVSWIWVTLEPGQSLSAMQAKIARSMGEKYRLQIRSSAELVAYFAEQARQAFSPLYLMEAITFLLVLIGIGDTLATGVLERTRQFGMMRAVGLRRSGLFRIVLLEGAAIAILGLVLAFCAGIALGLLWVKVQFPALLGWALDLHFPLQWAIEAAVLAVALSLIGAFLPSLRAALLAVPAALRNE